MVYAVKAVEGKELNIKTSVWAECKNLVFGKHAVYKACETENDADMFLKTASINQEQTGAGYMPVDMKKTLIYARYLFDRYDNTSNNGYSVRVYKTKQGKVTCKGYMLPNNEKLTYAMAGHFEKSEKYGYQFVVTSYKEHITDTKEGIIGYLSCGAIKGIGEKRATAIYQKFGSQTMEVFDTCPQKLLQIKGISKKVLDTIMDSYTEAKSSREIVSYLLSFGISQKYGMSLFKQYGTFAKQQIQKNPYLLCRLPGLTFKDAERVAEKEGIPKDDNQRFLYAAYHVLSQNEQSGSTGMEIQLFGNELKKLLKTDLLTDQQINQRVIDLIRNDRFRVNRIGQSNKCAKQYIFTMSAYNQEHHLATEILSHIKNIDLPVTAEAELTKREKAHGLSLDAAQKEAVLTSLQKSLMIMSGGPGSGKTTTTCLINELHSYYYPDMPTVFLAPTGRAARILAESTGKRAHTIHSYLKISADNICEENAVTISHSLVIVDEFSMVDINVALHLFRAICNDCHVVIVGDPDQLSSIKPGAVLRDMINSGVIPVVTLQNVYRTDEHAQICENAKRIRTKDTNIQEGSDFHIYQCSSMEDVRNIMAEQVIKYTKEYGLGNVLCLCPYWEHPGGINDMNRILQNALNPPEEGKAECTVHGNTFREGDLVIHTKTNEPDVVNGDIGIIEDIFTDDADGTVITVTINDTSIVYKGDRLELLCLAYACSIHKAQGSQASAVVTTLMPFHKGMIYYNIPYVAISRGRKQVSFCGDKDTLTEAILNHEKNERITLLKYFLLYESGGFVAA